MSPTVPAKAGRHDVEGGNAFIRAWVDQLNYAAATGDTSGLRRLSLETCKSCMRAASRFEKTYGDGGSVAGADWNLGTLDVFSASHMQGPVTTRRHEELDRSGETTQVFPASGFEVVFDLKWVDDQWLMERVVVVS